MPGTVAFSPEGAPYQVGVQLGGDGQGATQTNGGSATGSGGAAGIGFTDGGGRLGRLQSANGAAIDAVGVADGGAQTLAQSADLGADLYKKYCFAAETPIRTPLGSKLIKDIKAGEYVLASPEEGPNGPVEAKMVEEVFTNDALLVELLVSGRPIRTTGEHPFYVRGKGWLKATTLQKGDLLRSDDGQWVPVEGVEDTGEYETVYNLRVADYHTYFVGCQEWGFSVWSHNFYQTVANFFSSSGNQVLDLLKTGISKVAALFTKTCFAKGTPLQSNKGAVVRASGIRPWGSCPAPTRADALEAQLLNEAQSHSFQSGMLQLPVNFPTRVNTPLDSENLLLLSEKQRPSTQAPWKGTEG